MSRYTDAVDEAQTPVHDETIRAVAERHDVPEHDVRELLDQVAADIEEHELRSDFDEYHDFKGTSRGVRVYLCQHGLEIPELASAAAEQIFPGYGHVTPATLVTMAFDRDLRERHAGAVGGRDEAVGATSAADALLVRDDE
jgi:hypothetical protein